MKRRTGSSRRRRSGPGNATPSVKNVFSTLRRQSCRSSLAHFLVAKVDLFEAYFTCIRIISVISDKMHDDMNHGYPLPLCCGLALQPADHYKGNSHKLQPFGCKKVGGDLQRYDEVSARAMNRQSQSSFFKPCRLGC